MAAAAAAAAAAPAASGFSAAPAGLSYITYTCETSLTAYHDLPVAARHLFKLVMLAGQVQPPSQQATRHARRIYVGGLPPTANEQNIATFFSNALAAVGGTTAGPGMYLCAAFHLRLAWLQLTFACIWIPILTRPLQSSAATNARHWSLPVASCM